MRPALSRDARLLFAARSCRMFAYGSVSVILVLYLARIGLDAAAIGLLLSLTLIGDTLISLWLTTHADALGRRLVLAAGALLMAGAGAVFATTDVAALLLIAATLGVISPSGNEVGPFLAVEQAALAQAVPAPARTTIFAWYNLVGSVATALGALSVGLAVGWLRAQGMEDLGAYRTVIGGYAAIGVVLALLFRSVSSSIEVPEPAAADTTVARRLGLHRSRGVVLRLAALFSVDAFAGGLVMQSILAWWFHLTWGVPEPVLGAIFFGANLLAAASALAAARIAARIGLLNTMVFTHLPSNVLLILVPFMPTLPLAVAVLLARFAISQMDVPTRQSYTMAMVDPDERSAAAGVTGIARTTGTALSANLAAPLVATPGLAALPFVIGGGLKIAYDVLLWAVFRRRPVPEEPVR